MTRELTVASRITVSVDFRWTSVELSLCSVLLGLFLKWSPPMIRLSKVLLVQSPALPNEPPLIVSLAVRVVSALLTTRWASLPAVPPTTCLAVTVLSLELLIVTLVDSKPIV